MKIEKVEAFPIRLPRDMAAATGTAGSPTVLASGLGAYRWSTVFPCLYSVNFETALVKVTTDSGLVGWGEAQAPLAPQVACEIVRLLLAPVLEGEPFQNPLDDVTAFWERMYLTMRVRGQTGGFMLDAISGVDIALWDLAGKILQKPVCELLGERPKKSVRAYLSGLPAEGRTEAVRRYMDQGFDIFKLFFDTPDEKEFFQSLQHLPTEIDIAVDALWRLTGENAVRFGRRLDDLEAFWLEAPFPPEDPRSHADLSEEIETRIAIGESYRTRVEMRPFFEVQAVGVYQPDIGRCGITEGIRLAAMAEEHGAPVVPHISIALGPQIAAALHFAAAAPGCELAEFNPQVFSMANRFLHQPLVLKDASYLVPQGTGLGIEMNEEALAQVLR